MTMVTFDLDSGNLDNSVPQAIVHMGVLIPPKAGTIMPEPSKIEDRKASSPDISRHTPFEHEVTAEPEQGQSQPTTYIHLVGVWQATAGKISHAPALPNWMKTIRTAR